MTNLLFFCYPMKVILFVIGKTDEAYLNQGISIFTSRIKRYVPFEIIEIPGVKNSGNKETQKQKEGELILNHPEVISADYKILLDEKGIQFTSVEFANFVQKQLNRGFRKIIFIIGGPFGFSENLNNKLKEWGGIKLSLSKQTFSHQMVRLFFAEQLYRSFTILKGEKYHHS